MDRGYVVSRRTHPKENASIFSLVTFSYIFGLVIRGNKKDLEEDDITGVMQKFESSKLGDKIEKTYDEMRKKCKKISIMRLLFKLYFKRYFLLSLFELTFKVIYVFVVPYSIGKLVNYFKKGQIETSWDDALYYGCIVIIVNSILLAGEQHYMLIKHELGLKVTISMSSFLYRKALKLKTSTLAEITSGKIVTCITKDLISLEDAIYFINDLWVEITQGAIVLYLLYRKVGISGFLGLSTVLVVMVLQLYLGSLIFKKRSDANSKSDERLQLTQEILTSIRIIKMYTWEKFFGQKLIHLRKKEINKLRTLVLLKFTIGLLGQLCTKLSFLLVIIFYIQLGNNLTSETVYFIVTCFMRIRKTVVFLVPVATSTTAELAASLKRISNIINAEEIENHTDQNQIINPKINLISANLTINDIKILKNVNLKLESGLNVLIGPVGCGKSSLIKTILQEYTINEGKFLIDGKISYSSQNPWVFPSSIKQNILFGQKYNESKYKKVLELCALKFDLDGLANGDDTVLSDCGINLSKGQQTRINIARALYKESDIYIIDDSLSSLDGTVKNYIFKNCIQNFLKNKLVILATHDTKFVEQSDNVVIMQDGAVTYCGKPNDLPKNLSQSLESINKEVLDEETIEEDETEEFDEKSKLVAEICKSTKANIYHEVQRKGGVGWETYKKYFGFGGGVKIFLFIILLYALAEISSSYSEKVLNKWVSSEESIAYLKANYSNNSTSLNITSSSDSIVELIGDNNIYIYAYSGLLTTFVILSCVSIFFFFIFSLTASKNLHKIMINNILGSTMHFFDTNLSGNIINRFSVDLYQIDEWIPYLILKALKMSTMMFATIGLIASINRTFTVLSLSLLVIFICVCKYLTRPLRSIRRLYNATKSPVIGHLNSSLEGLVTIRSYKTESILVSEFDKHLNLFVTTQHLFMVMAKGLAFWLHVLSAIFIAIIILFFLFKDQNESSANVGMAITQSFVLATFLDWAIRQFVYLESFMTAFQRAADYTDIKQENQSGRQLENWPSDGAIQYKDVSLRYRKNNEEVLKNLNFHVKPREKIGIVGRTGAGKSSIIVTLFRLYEVNGDILIDGVPIKTIPLGDLRNHLGIIPQDPIIFSGSVRSNIDPTGIYNDDDIWSALGAVNLKSIIKNLDDDIKKSGVNYSIGRRQLVCLARAIVRKNKIIIMDEATANMDEETDRFIHEKIEELFKNCTTITVAHRLSSVMRCDRVMVMDKGEVVEFDSPQNLLKDCDSFFFKMANSQHS